MFFHIRTPYIHTYTYTYIYTEYHYKYTHICICEFAQTTLAMSMLWALTGSLDIRLVTDGRAADVAFDNYIRKGQVDNSADIDLSTDSKVIGYCIHTYIQYIIT